MAWAATRPGALSAPAAETVADPTDELGLSPVTVWDLLALVRKGRLDLGADWHAWVQRHIIGSAVPKVIYALTAEIASRSERLVGYANPDSADRFLAATALEHDLALVTADASLRGYTRLRTLW